MERRRPRERGLYAAAAAGLVGHLHCMELEPPVPRLCLPTSSTASQHPAPSFSEDLLRCLGSRAGDDQIPIEDDAAVTRLRGSMGEAHRSWGRQLPWLEKARSSLTWQQHHQYSSLLAKQRASRKPKPGSGDSGAASTGGAGVGAHTAGNGAGVGAGAGAGAGKATTLTVPEKALLLELQRKMDAEARVMNDKLKEEAQLRAAVYHFVHPAVMDRVFMRAHTRHRQSPQLIKSAGAVRPIQIELPATKTLRASVGFSFRRVVLQRGACPRLSLKLGVSGVGAARGCLSAVLATPAPQPRPSCTDFPALCASVGASLVLPMEALLALVAACVRSSERDFSLPVDVRVQAGTTIVSCGAPLAGGCMSSRCANASVLRRTLQHMANSQQGADDAVTRVGLADAQAGVLPREDVPVVGDEKLPPISGDAEPSKESAVNTSYRLCRIGDVSLIVQSSLDGYLGPSGTDAVVVEARTECSLHRGWERLSIPEVARLYARCVVHPDSSLLLGRFDPVHLRLVDTTCWKRRQLVAVFRQINCPELCLRLHHVIGQLKTAPAGQFILRWRPGEQTMSLFPAQVATTTAPAPVPTIHTGTIPYLPLQPHAQPYRGLGTLPPKETDLTYCRPYAHAGVCDRLRTGGCPLAHIQPPMPRAPYIFKVAVRQEDLKPKLSQRVTEEKLQPSQDGFIYVPTLPGTHHCYVFAVDRCNDDACNHPHVPLPRLLEMISLQLAQDRLSAPLRLGKKKKKKKKAATPFKPGAARAAKKRRTRP